MPIKTVPHDKNNPYTALNSSIASDPSISYKAKGIWFYALTRPADWKFYSSEIAKHCCDGKDSLESGLKELEKAGYLERSRERLPNGRLGRIKWTWYEITKEKYLQKMKEITLSESTSPRSEKPPQPTINIEPKKESAPRWKIPQLPIINLKPNINKKKECRESKTKQNPVVANLTPSEPAARHSLLLFSLIKEHHDRVKEPNFKKWNLEFEKMHRIDKYSWEEIGDLIRFCQQDDFWCTNILSPGKLRKQALTLVLQLKKKGFISREQVKRNSDHEERRDYAKIWAKKTTPGTIFVLMDKVEFYVGDVKSYLYYSENAFKEQFDNNLRKIGAL